MPYQLEVHLPDHDIETLDIIDSCVLGSSEEAEVCIQDHELPAKLCRFRVGQDVLTVMNLSAQKPPLKIGKQKLERGKMYILDHEDILTCGDLKIIVHEVALHNSVDDEQESELPFPSTQDLTHDETPHEEDTQEEDEPTSISVTQVLRQAKEETGELEFSQPEEKTKRPESTSSRLLQIKEKVKSIVTKRRERSGPVKAPAAHIVTNKKVNRAKRTTDWPGFIPRLLALFLELGGSALLATQLTARPEVFASWSSLLEKVDQMALQNPQLDILSKILMTLELQGFLTLVLYAILQILIGFLFGRSLGLIFMGINEDSGFIKKRIKSVLRSLIFFVTGPFFIFELPILFKRHSFKEWITRSALYQPSPWPGVFSALLIFPPLILGLLVSSTFGQRETFPLEISSLRSTPTEQKYLYSALDLLFPKTVIEDFPALPSLSQEYTAQNPGPGLWLFYKGEEQEPLGVFKGPSYELNAWIGSFFKDNPFLTYINPDLMQLHESAQTPGRLSLKQRQSLKQLVRDSLTLKMPKVSEIPLLLQTYGPELGSLNKFSQGFRQSLSLGPDEKLTWYSFSKKDILWREQIDENTFRVQVISLSSTPFRSLYFTGSLEQKDDIRNFIQENLLQIEFIQPGPSPSSAEIQDLSHLVSAQLLQLFSHQKGQGDFHDELYQLLLKFTGEQLNKDKNLYRDLFEKQMQTLLKWPDELKLQKPELSAFLEKLSPLLEAYQDKKTRFFIEESNDSR